MPAKLQLFCFDDDDYLTKKCVGIHESLKMTIC